MLVEAVLFRWLGSATEEAGDLQRLAPASQRHAKRARRAFGSFRGPSLSEIPVAEGEEALVDFASVRPNVDRQAGDSMPITTERAADDVVARRTSIRAAAAEAAQIRPPEQPSHVRPLLAAPRHHS